MPLSKQRDKPGHNKYRFFLFFFFVLKPICLEFSTNAHHYLDGVSLKRASCTCIFQHRIKWLLKTHLFFFSSNKLPNCKAFPVQNQITRKLGICKSHIRQGLPQTEPFTTHELDRGLVSAGCGCWDSTVCLLTSAAFSLRSGCKFKHSDLVRRHPADFRLSSFYVRCCCFWHSLCSS